MYSKPTKLEYTESARAVTGRLCPNCCYSGVREDFLAHRPFFFFKKWPFLRNERSKNRTESAKSTVTLRQNVKTACLHNSGPSQMGCQCGSFFLVAQMVPPSFISHDPKLRVLMLAFRDWPEMSKIQNKTWKMTPSSKNGQLWPKMAILVILGQIFAFMVYFDGMNDQKTMGTRCPVGFLICEYQNFCPLSKKLGFGPKNGQI